MIACLLSDRENKQKKVRLAEKLNFGEIGFFGFPIIQDIGIQNMDIFNNSYGVYVENGFSPPSFIINNINASENIYDGIWVEDNSDIFIYNTTTSNNGQAGIFIEGS